MNIRCTSPWPEANLVLMEVDLLSNTPLDHLFMHLHFNLQQFDFSAYISQIASQLRLFAICQHFAFFWKLFLFNLTTGEIVARNDIEAYIHTEIRYLRGQQYPESSASGLVVYGCVR